MPAGLPAKKMLKNKNLCQNLFDFCLAKVAK